MGDLQMLPLSHLPALQAVGKSEHFPGQLVSQNLLPQQLFVLPITSWRGLVNPQGGMFQLREKLPLLCKVTDIRAHDKGGR